MNATRRQYWPTLLYAAIAGSLAGLVTSGADTLIYAGAFAVLLTGAFIVLASPAAGLAALVFAIFINLSDVLIEFHGLPSVAKAYLPLFALLIAFEWATGRKEMVIPVTGLLLLAAYAVVLSLSYFYAVDIGRVTDGFVAFAKNLLFAIAVALLAADRRHFRACLWAIVLGALMLGTMNLLHALGINSDFGGFAQAAVSYVHEDGSQARLSGPIEDPNFFAQFMLIGLAVAFERAISEQRLGLKLVAAITVVAALAAIVLTYSRGALIVVALMAPIAAYSLRRQRRFLVLAVLLVLAAVPVLPGGYLERAAGALPIIGIEVSGAQSPDVSVRGRMGEMRVAWQMFVDHPLLGVGYNNYEIYFQKYSLALDQLPRGEGRPAHSLYLEIAAERGVVGLLAFAALIGYVLFLSAQAWHRLVRDGEHRNANMITGVAVGFGAYLVAAAALHDAYPRYMWLMIGLLLATPGVARATPGDKLTERISA